MVNVSRRAPIWNDCLLMYSLSEDNWQSPFPKEGLITKSITEFLKGLIETNAKFEFWFRQNKTWLCI